MKTTLKQTLKQTLLQQAGLPEGVSAQDPSGHGSSRYYLLLEQLVKEGKAEKRQSGPKGGTRYHAV